MTTGVILGSFMPPHEGHVALIQTASYLVDDAGAVAYVGRPVAKFDAPKAQLFRLIIDGAGRIVRRSSVDFGQQGRPPWKRSAR